MAVFALAGRFRDALRALEPIIRDYERNFGKSPYPWDRGKTADELFDETPLSELYLSVRTTRCLTHFGFRTVGDLAGKTDDELLGISQFGLKSLRELREVLKEHRLEIEREKAALAKRDEGQPEMKGRA